MARPGTFDRTTVADGWFDPTAQPIGWACEDGLQDAPALNSYSLDAQPGAFAVTGADAGVVRGLALDAQPAAFLLTGADAGLVKTNVYLLDAQPGAFALSGAESGLVWSGEPAVEESRQTPAGRPSKDRKRKERRRYMIGERQYWADESELPGLILAVAAKPEKQPAPVANRRAKASRRAPEAAVQAPVVAVAAAAPASLQARLEALRRQFQMAENEVLLRSLAIVAERLAEMEDDEMVLLLA